MKNKDNYLMLNGKKVELTEEQIRKLGLKENKNIFDKVDLGETYYFIQGNGNISDRTMGFIHREDNKNHLVANYCTDKEVFAKRAKEEVLNRLLWRFTMENGWDDKRWENACENYYIAKPNLNNNYYFVCVNREHYSALQTVYFVSKEIAQQAIDGIVIPFERGELEVCKTWEE